MEERGHVQDVLWTPARELFTPLHLAFLAISWCVTLPTLRTRV